MKALPQTVVDSIGRAPWGWVLAATVLVALIKAWPALAQQAIEARQKLRQERRTDLGDCQKQIAELRLQLKGVEELVGNLKIEMNGILSAYRILEGAEEARDPESIHLKHARAILSTAFAIAPSTSGVDVK